MNRKFALVTGASSGIGYELALICAKEGYDLAIAADSPDIYMAATTFQNLGVEVIRSKPTWRPRKASIGSLLRPRGVPSTRSSPTRGTGWGVRFSISRSTRSGT